MQERIEEQYADVLQNIESAIVAVFEADPTLLDRHVVAALDALIEGYAREGSKRAASARRPGGRSGAVYDGCRRMCEWRLGRAPLNPGEPGTGDSPGGALSVAELVRCLKRLKKSVRTWHKQGGPQGYLAYVRQFLE